MRFATPISEGGRASAQTRFGELVLFGNQFPLTPALSPRERENPRQSVDESDGVEMVESRPWLLPLPRGEGRGEGERDARNAPGRHKQISIQGLRPWLCLGLLVLAWCRAQADPTAETTAYAQGLFREAQARCRHEPANPQAAWEFGRACFELAECATNRAQRAQIADQGIAACRRAIARATNSGPAHYYLGVNLGQMARTKGFGALKLVGLMRQEFDLARSLDEHVDYAGPDRNLGQLYRDAPPIASIGNRAQAEQHLRRAVALAPDFPDNHLELIEGYLKWGQRDQARRELNALETSWPAARAKLTGPAWARSWADWEKELRKFKKESGMHSSDLSKRAFFGRI